jgi:tyrosyl-tRNA synthetase
MQGLCSQRLTKLCTSTVRLSLDEKHQLALSVAEECVQPDELRNLLDKKPNPIAYDGFEPSGRMHIAQVCLRIEKSLESGKLRFLL